MCCILIITHVVDVFLVLLVGFVVKSHQTLYPPSMALLGLMANRYCVEDVQFFEIASYFLRTYTTRITRLNRKNFQEKCTQKAQTVPLGGPICLPWFLVHNRWFKNSYLQDQPVNLWDTLCLLFSRKMMNVLDIIMQNMNITVESNDG